LSCDDINFNKLTKPLQWRWIVERTFGWLNRSQRLSKDFEALPETTETWIRIAMIHLMVRRLAARA
jgi:transposase